MRAGPVMHPSGGRSPADPIYHPFWKVVADAGITVAYHSGESGYGRYAVDWGESAEFESFRRTPLYGVLTSHRAISDTVAALVCHGLFDRFPRLRVATIESGSEWVAPLVKELAKSWSMTPGGFVSNPVETLRRHVWVAPYYEDDIRDARRHARRRPRAVRIGLAPRRGARRADRLRPRSTTGSATTRSA